MRHLPCTTQASPKFAYVQSSGVVGVGKTFRGSKFFDVNVVALDLKPPYSWDFVLPTCCHSSAQPFSGRRKCHKTDEQHGQQQRRGDGRPAG